jgi:hypothetical protein
MLMARLQPAPLLPAPISDPVAPLTVFVSAAREGGLDHGIAALSTQAAAIVPHSGGERPGKVRSNNTSHPDKQVKL